MDAAALRDRLEHPAFSTTAATLVGYSALLALIFVVLFVLPYLVLSAL